MSGYFQRNAFFEALSLGPFNPHLASMGVLLGVLSNVIGNYCRLIAGVLYKRVVV